MRATDGKTRVRPAYSPTVHIARSLGAHSPKRLMAMLTAYIDDSGTDKNSPIAVAAGFVSDVGRWKRFEGEWRAILKANGLLEKGFHMKYFRAKVRRGQYAKLSDGDVKSLYDLLIRTINGHALMGFSASVRKADYDAKIHGKLRQKLGGHYRFCAAVCVWTIQKWLRSQPESVREPVEFVFAQGTNGNNEVFRLFQDLSRYPAIQRDFGIRGTPAFKPADACYPLQAADVIAWNSTQHLRQFDPSVQFMPELPKGKVAWCRFFPASSLDGYVPSVTAKYEALNWNAPPGGFV